jgi:hypothetical protein
MDRDPYDIAIDQILAGANGDIRLALRTVLMQNLQLEAKLMALSQKIPTRDSSLPPEDLLNWKAPGLNRARQTALLTDVVMALPRRSSILSKVVQLPLLIKLTWRLLRHSDRSGGEQAAAAWGLTSARLIYHADAMAIDHFPSLPPGESSIRTTTKEMIRPVGSENVDQPHNRRQRGHDKANA